MPKKSRREHGNSTRDSDKRGRLLELVKRDVDQSKACAYVGIPVSTLHDWLNRDEDLSEQYSYAESYMDIITSNVIASAINDKNLSIQERAKMSLEWKRRRDKRYSEKQEVFSTNNNTIDITHPKEIEKALKDFTKGIKKGIDSKSPWRKRSKRRRKAENK